MPEKYVQAGPINPEWPVETSEREALRWENLVMRFRKGEIQASL
jgi:hypothetical protein